MTMTLRAEVSDITDPESSISDLLDEFNREHGLCLQAKKEAVIRAMKCGDILLQIRPLVPKGTWVRWCHENLPIGHFQATVYMRLAIHRELVEQSGLKEIKRAAKMITREGECTLHDFVTVADPMAEVEVKRLRDQGLSMTAITLETGLGWYKVRKILMPEWYEDAKRKDAVKRKRYHSREAKRNEAFLKIKQRGGSLSKAYSQVRKTLDFLQAERDSDLLSSEVKAAIATAMHRLYEAEDAIVKASKLQ